MEFEEEREEGVGWDLICSMFRYTVKKGTTQYGVRLCRFLALSYPTASVLHTIEGLESNKCSSTPGLMVHAES